eukprot:4972383-Lingulodinium_polyedra.AAC.1
MDQFSARAWSARACGYRGDGETPVRPRHCAARQNRCAMMWWNRRFAAAAARESRVCVLHARAGFRSARGARERAVCGSLRRRNAN